MEDTPESRRPSGGWHGSEALQVASWLACRLTQSEHWFLSRNGSTQTGVPALFPLRTERFQIADQLPNLRVAQL